MRKVLLLLLLATAPAISNLEYPLAITAIAAPPQSANKIIDRYKKAIGGGAVKRIRNTVMTGSVRIGEDRSGRFSYQIAGPDRVRIDIEMNGLKVSQCYNGKSAWRQDSSGLRTLLGPEAKRLRLHALIANTRLHDLSRYRILAQAAGKATIDGRQADVVEVSMSDIRAKLFFDTASNLLIKQEQETSGDQEEIFYSDYRKTDGVMEPFSVRIKNGASELAITIERIEHNRAIDEMAFRYPRLKDSRPLPDVESLMKAIIASQEKIEQLRENYTFLQTETERKHDGDGRVKGAETKVYEVTPLAGGFVYRLIKVNGKELSASEREKEDRRVQKDAEEIIKKREKRLKQQQRARERGEKSEDDEGQIAILSFLRISEITSMRRETFRGHEVIAFDFEPRKGFKPKNMIENVISKLAGTMWVDESAQQIVRLEARLIDSFKIGGGLLASLSPSSAFVFEQEKIGDEVWLPSYEEVNFSARLFLFAKFNRSVTTRYSDYKKYQIDSDYKLGQPKVSGKPNQ